MDGPQIVTSSGSLSTYPIIRRDSFVSVGVLNAFSNLNTLQPSSKAALVPVFNSIEASDYYLGRTSGTTYENALR